MSMKAVIVCILATAIVATGVSAKEPAQVGSALADVFEAFAPLAVLHSSYADHLFYGTDVTIPESLDSACDDTGYLLASLHLELSLQTGSAVIALKPWLVRIRANLAAFCDHYAQILAFIAAMEIPDLTFLKEASDLEFFSEIYHLRVGLQTAFDVYLEGITDGRDLWSFSVSFSLRTLLGQATLERVDPGLRAILYGADDATTPPIFLPSAIVETIERLTSLIDMDFDTESAAMVRSLALAIYEFVMEEV